MKCTLIKATQQYKSVINNLMQFYMYDFSAFIDIDVQDDGTFSSYQYLDSYWEETGKRFIYVIKNEEKCIGFILVKYNESGERDHFSIAEFFVLKKYREKGIGSAAASQVFDLHRGPWQVHQEERNKPAQLFWRKVIDNYTNGKFSELVVNGKTIQQFSN